MWCSGMEQADGPERIFAKHMPRKDGKYIVFCSGWEHIQDMAELSKKWFSSVDKIPTSTRQIIMIRRILRHFVILRQI